LNSDGQDRDRSDDGEPRPHSMPLERSLLVWDGECGFCRRWAAWLVRNAGGQLDSVPYQRLGERVATPSNLDFPNYVHLFLPDGRVLRGGAAALHALSLQPHRLARWPLVAHQRIAGIACVVELAYRLVARHRRRLARFSPRDQGEPLR